MKKLMWWVLSIPLIPFAGFYYLLRAIYIAGDYGDWLADKMYDSKLRLRYIKWRNEKFG